MTFQLDTSGEVAGGHVWSDLSPFTQGYIEALFSGFMVPGPDGPEPLLFPAFSDLAPETLARIIADCEAADKASRDFGYQSTGLEFWKVRQAGLIDNFPPLTVQLGDDGKVRFAAPARSSEGEGAQ